MKANKRVSQTAYATAQFWAAGGFKHAELFSSRRGWLAHQGLRLGQLLGKPFLPVSIQQFDRYTMARHRAFEIQLEAFKPSAVIEIAAGLSGRGLNYAERWPDVPYLEIDLPDMVAEKRQRLSSKILPSNLQLLAADALADNFAELVLGQELLQGKLQRAVIITEGLQDYFGRTEKHRLWQSVAALLEAADAACYLFEAWPANRLGKSPWLEIGLLGLSAVTRQNMRERLFDDAAEAISAATDSGLPDVGLVPAEDIALAFDGLEPSLSPWQLFSAVK